MHDFQTIYSKIGEEKIKKLVHYFYEEVALNPDLRALYPEELAPAEERLFLFLLQVFGGPQTYSEKRGHPMLRRRHFNWEIGGRMRDAWLNAMMKAMDKMDFDSTVKDQMLGYFVKVANHMVNKQ
ncbi:cyanoglobin [Litoribacter ruber]|uniref:Cyanoglobin n=1 Tax=Litoribacter ruber TaxID=702568 RepID=A0AAP2G0S7_9BACT|nr:MULTISPECIES: cyanoglobin [Litoribacter]MBS9522847.1 cyanoglobin [Litoribacter alkaliphilus]MBT0812354.1 cyanoglobin [Litoribacter ruber]